MFRGKCLPCGHLCRCSIGKAARKERNSNDRVREYRVKGWLSSALCLLKLGTEFSVDTAFLMSTLEAKQGKFFENLGSFGL